MTDYRLLNTVNSPEDLKNIPERLLPELAGQLRDFLVKNVSNTGGHLASNLGVVELTIALHRVFNAPGDKIIFDVGHQCYVHKIVTGRRESFKHLREMEGLSGYPKTSESEYDAFNTGHSGTSVSAALGMARAREIKRTNEAIVAVIGDGALTGGIAFEALNDAGQSKLPIIIVLNDNNMSISRNVGAMNRYLNSMRTSLRYQNFKKDLVSFLDRFSSLGKSMSRFLERFKNRIKYFLLPNVLFEELGFTYLGPIDGHDIRLLQRVLDQAKNIMRPVIVHVKTKKGKGYKPAEENPEKFHGVGEFDPSTGILHKEGRKRMNSDIFGDALVQLAKDDELIAAITAAMPEGTGLMPFAEKFRTRFFDVGIAEQHAVTMAAGMAASGMKPVVAIYSSFLQRAYDQIIHDVCLQNLHVIFAVDRAGLVGRDGETHQGAYDIAYLSHMPNMTVYSPASLAELKSMLKQALQLGCPAAIRYNRGLLPESVSDRPLEYGKWDVIKPLGLFTVVVTGRLVETVIGLDTDTGIVNARFVKPVDCELLENMKQKCKAVLVIEDGVITGGLGSVIAQRLSPSRIRVECMGLPDRPVPQGSIAEQDEYCGLSKEHIHRRIKEISENL
ncbi:MAG: 1-deoxy-D-xylulose-5-phosphate synthase [Firmicutes bacterium ADurb.Bin182]|nr:MAG: 1-deoxy-D-xylulose-5-phosphate synthase [Firmicutes bacterium ADurb.Bin182]